MLRTCSTIVLLHLPYGWASCRSASVSDDKSHASGDDTIRIDYGNGDISVGH